MIGSWAGKLGLCSLILVASTAIAHPVEKKKHHWKGSNASFGFNEATGNTNTSTLNTGLNLIYTKHPWKEAANFTANYGKENGNLSQERYFVQNQLNYALNKAATNFVFINVNSTFDQFSPYNYILNTSAGYGRQIFNTNRFTLTAQIGPGWSRTKERENHEIQNQVTLSPRTTFDWQVTKNNLLTEVASANFSQQFNHYISITSLTNNILRHLATSINFQLDYYSRIPETSSKTKKLDTTTSINLVYTF